MFDFMWLFYCWDRTPVDGEDEAGWAQRPSDRCREEINLLPLRELNLGPCSP